MPPVLEKIRVIIRPEIICDLHSYLWNIKLYIYLLWANYLHLLKAKIVYK